MDRRRLPLQLLDTVGYAVAVTAVVFLVGAGLATAAGRQPLVGAKWFMFLVGFGLLAYSAFQLRPTPKWKQDEEGGNGNGGLLGTDTNGQVGLQAAVTRLVPDDYRLPADERHSAALKLFVASVFVLVASFLMETVFGVAVAA
ncbi:hypothetical protein SAMN04487949_0178 [Halogranum gelatinilyticum]|uniref:Uncharacterized protein n=1 Tax=Halogranum gelatinilyticum TaxID=660521 RepID=A0A1G9NZS3_9EURY|nr:hypothetical protein [Halogranum gelatinilyticum]SDL92086.1 hypothetical protein SAMN04487949_0178 [Halogranum gelatinilyticum]